MFLNFFGYTGYRQKQDPEAVIKFPLVRLTPCMAIATLCLGDKRKGVDDGLLRAAVALSSASLSMLLTVVSEFGCRAKVQC